MRNRKPNRKLVLTVVLLGLVAVGTALALRPNLIRMAPINQPKLVMLSELYQAVAEDARAGYRDTVTIEPERAVAATTSGLKVAWTGGSDTATQLREALKDAGVSPSEAAIQFQQPPSTASRLLWYLLPILLLIGVLLLVMRQTGAITGRAFSFGKSRARRFQASASTVTLDDVAGVDEAKQEVAE